LKLTATIGRWIERESIGADNLSIQIPRKVQLAEKTTKEKSHIDWNKLIQIVKLHTISAAFYEHSIFFLLLRRFSFVFFLFLISYH
jgi:hypothetical protein